MLVTLTPNHSVISQNKEYIKNNPKLFDDLEYEYIPAYKKESQHKGIYIDRYFPFDEFLEFDKKPDPEQRLQTFPKSDYIVCDTIEQALEYWSEEIESHDQYFIVVAPIYQEVENRGRGGGWRWEKWGPYIGKLNPQCEYLDDEEFEDFIGYVLIANIYKVPRKYTLNFCITDPHDDNMLEELYEVYLEEDFLGYVNYKQWSDKELDLHFNK